jgi:DNA (cytosine-5)-methyltransferase 1
MDNIAPDSTLWREMAHVKRKVDDPRLNFKNTLYTGNETKIATITATYAAPKIGAPMVSHPENPYLQRQFTVNEHAKIRQLPERMHNAVMDIATGTNPLVSKSGSITAAHRMLGNSVSKSAWVHMGKVIGDYLNQLSFGNKVLVAA